jgi:hypothetical protein
MSREANMLSLVNSIIREPYIKTSYADFGTSSRISYSMNIIPILNSSLLLFRSWTAFIRGNEDKQKEVENIELYVKWLQSELKGYKGCDNKEVLELAGYRKIDDGFVKYGISILQLALNQDTSLEYMGKEEGLNISRIFPIVDAVYRLMIDKVIEIGKELDPKMESMGDIDGFERRYGLGADGSDDDYYGNDEFKFSNEITE